MKRSFVRYVSHEIRTPLNCIKLGLDLARNYTAELPRVTKNKSEILDAIIDSASSCSLAVDIMNDLLLYEKMEDGLMELNLGQYEGISLVKDSVNQMKIWALSYDVNFNLKIATPSIKNETINLYCDKGKILQVLRNLLSNACKFSKPGGVIDIVVSIVHTNDKENAAPILQKDYYSTISYRDR